MWAYIAAEVNVFGQWAVRESILHVIRIYAGSVWNDRYVM